MKLETQLKSRRLYLYALSKIKPGDRVSYMGNKGICIRVYIHGPSYAILLLDNGSFFTGTIDVKYLRPLEEGVYETQEAKDFYEKWERTKEIYFWHTGVAAKISGYGGVPGTLVIHIPEGWYPPEDIKANGIEYWNYMRYENLLKGWHPLNEHNKWSNPFQNDKKTVITSGYYRIKDIWENPEEAVL